MMKKFFVSLLTLMLLLSATPTLAADATVKATVTLSTLLIREYPSPKSKAIGSFKRGNITYIHDVRPGGWAEIRYNGKPAYVPLKYLKILGLTKTIHTISEIKQKWKQYEPTFQGDPYVVKPNVTPPYSIGKLNNELINDGIKMVNFVRYLAGLPDDITSDKSLNELSQYGAVLLAANGYLDHYPPKPKSMSDAFFNLGYKSTSSSNLAMMRYYDGLNISYLADSVGLYMSDSDTSNIDRVGHRRWVLNPYMQKIGFGLASDGIYCYSPMYVLDSSRSDNVNFNWDYTSWPSKGYFPDQFFDSLDAWSIHLNPDLYSEPILDNIKVTLIRLNDNKQWTFTKLNNTVTSSDDYLNVNSDNYGNSYAIIFRPSGVNSYENSTYKVIVSGVQKENGEKVKIEFITQFFDLWR